MPVQRLNHAVLYVRDVERSHAFYRDVLGFRAKMEIPGRGGVPAGGGLDQRPRPRPVPDRRRRRRRPRPAARTVGLYHLAWEVDTLAELSRIRDALLQAGALVGASDHATTKALYAQDPDGIEFEVSWLLPADLITPEVDAQGAAMTAPLDLEREIERYGAQTRGGVGVSVPALSARRVGPAADRHGSTAWNRSNPSSSTAGPVRCGPGATTTSTPCWPRCRTRTSGCGTAAGCTTREDAVRAGSSGARTGRGDHASWAVVDAASRRALGSVSLHSIDPTPGRRGDRLLDGAGSPGRGVAAAAVDAACRWAFATWPSTGSSCATRSRTPPRAGSPRRPGSPTRATCAAPTATATG